MNTRVHVDYRMVDGQEPIDNAARNEDRIYEELCDPARRRSRKTNAVGDSETIPGG